MRAGAKKLIHAYYARFNAGDAQGMLDLLADQVVHDVNQGPCRKGKPAFRRFLQRMNHCYRERISNLTVMLTADGKLGAALFDLTGRYLRTDGRLPKARGQRYRLRCGAFFEIRGGKIARVSTHYNRGDWLKQVGGRRSA